MIRWMRHIALSPHIHANKSAEYAKHPGHYFRQLLWYRVRIADDLGASVFALNTDPPYHRPLIRPLRSNRGCLKARGIFGIVAFEWPTYPSVLERWDKFIEMDIRNIGFSDNVSSTKSQ